MPHLIDRIWNLIENGERLSEADALALYESPELVAIGEMADHINRKKNADVVFYNVNRHINPTNICALSCKFCAYSRKPGEEGGYAYSIEEMVAKAGEAVQSGATEVHMVGGLHPRWRYEHYRDMIAAIKKAYPDLHLKAFTAVELDWLARKARKSIAEVLSELREAGLGSLPGGGAEIFAPEIRDTICDTKVSAEQWLGTHRTAHQMGLRSNCTMLYGHIEKYPHRVDHMRRLRELQDETKGFNAFIPLSFQPFQNEMGIDRYTFGYDDLKTISIARLFLDNFQHIKAYWVMLGQDIAQIALKFGANDLDGTIVEEKISRMAGGRAGMAMSRSFLESLIRKADRIPCERDTLYQPVQALPKQEQTLSTAAQLPERSDRFEDLMQLAQFAPLHELGKRAQAFEQDASASLSPTHVMSWQQLSNPELAVQACHATFAQNHESQALLPPTLTIDLAAGETSSTPGAESKSTHSNPSGAALQLLEQSISALRREFPQLQLVVAGFKSLWRLAQDADTKIDSVLSRLIAAGVQQFESSPEETETDLTTAEVINLHRQIHAHGVGSIGRIELNAPSQWAMSRDPQLSDPSQKFSSPMWESFIRRALALAELNSKTSQLVGVSVEVAPGSFVTPGEYLRAVAIARLACPNIPLLIAPLARIPTLSPIKGLGTHATQHPTEKYAAIALHYGANDLGPIESSRFSPTAIMQQIRGAGMVPKIRSSLLAENQKDGAFAYQFESIRHRPEIGINL